MLVLELNILSSEESRLKIWTVVGAGDLSPQSTFWIVSLDTLDLPQSSVLYANVNANAIFCSFHGPNPWTAKFALKRELLDGFWCTFLLLKCCKFRGGECLWYLRMAMSFELLHDVTNVILHCNRWWWLVKVFLCSYIFDDFYWPWFIVGIHSLSKLLHTVLPLLAGIAECSHGGSL